MKIEDSKPRWGLVWVIFIVLGILAVLPFFLFGPKPLKDLPSYSIQNFTGPVQIYWAETKKWGPARRGAGLASGDKIKTGEKGEIDIFVPEQVNIRIKENSEVEVKTPRSSRQIRYRLHVVRGALLGTTHKKKLHQDELEITTPVLVAAIRGTTFHVEVDPKTQESVVRVLEGQVQVQSIKTKKSVLVKELERTSVKGKSSPTQPVHVTRKEWDKLKEGYDLFERSPVQETRQIDLSKQAGNLFEYVLDHGTFYTPDFGFSDREFFLDETTQKVILRVDYDVFPGGSFVGMYLKTRDLDLSKVKALEFEVRNQSGEGFPDSVRVEFKGVMGMLRVFVPRDFRETWRSYSYPINVRQQALVSEITLVFSNDRAKSHKKGSLYFRNLNFIPQDKPVALPEKPAAPEAAAPPQASQTV